MGWACSPGKRSYGGRVVIGQILAMPLRCSRYFSTGVEALIWQQLWLPERHGLVPEAIKFILKENLEDG